MSDETPVPETPMTRCNYCGDHMPGHDYEIVFCQECLDFHEEEGLPLLLHRSHDLDD